MSSSLKESLELVLPYPPSVNHFKKVGCLTRTKSGKLYQARVNSPETTAYYYRVWHYIRSRGLKSFGSATISVEVLVHPPDKRKRDLDGILKVLLDSLQRGGLFDDDAQVARLLVTRCGTMEDGQIIVEVSEIEK